MYELGRSFQFYDDFKHIGLGSIRLAFAQSWVYREDLENWTMQGVKRKAKEFVRRIARA